MLSTHRRRLLWLTVGRAVVATLVLGSAPLIRDAGAGTYGVSPFYALVAVIYALTIVYASALNVFERRPHLVDMQLAFDVIVISAFVYLTGGVSSYFSSLYTLPIIAATTVHSRRSGVMLAALSCALYGGLVVAQYAQPEVFERVSGLATFLPPAKLGLYTVVLNLFGFAAVAALSGYLAEGLRQADVQLQRATDRIEDLQAFSRHVIDSLTSGLATTDKDGRILTFNRAALAITGIAESDAVNADAIDVLSLPPDFVGLFCGSEDAPLPRVEWWYRRPDGKRIELGVSTAALVTPRGERGFLLTFRDVTEARRQEREQRVQQRLAAVGEMAAGIAHEIRNPLASMVGSIQILRQDLPLTAEQSQLMDIVLRESERLNDTIRSFLAYARPQRPPTSALDVRRAVTDTARLLENSADVGATHVIAVDVPEHEVLIDADEAQLRQIVWNLATNGLRAMPDGGRLTLSIGAGAAGSGSETGHVFLGVRDEGTGIAPEELDGIFQPFRGGFARGSGLGLSIVQRIVTEYGGEIHVTSDPGAGTFVQVRLPATRSVSEPALTAGKVD